MPKKSLKKFFNLGPLVLSVDGRTALLGKMARWRLTKRPAILRALDPAFHGQLDQLLAGNCLLQPPDAATVEQHRRPRPPTNKKKRVSAAAASTTSTATTTTTVGGMLSIVCTFSRLIFPIKLNFN
jgi:hypothetical protein